MDELSRRCLDMKASLLLIIALPITADAQTIELDWLNQPCATLLHCDSGCTACNMAVNSSAAFNGTGLARVGVDICPLPDGNGDNVLATYGWDLVVDSTRALFLSAIALQPMHIDSLIIRHRTSPDGPGTVQLSLSVNNVPSSVIGEIVTSGSLQETVLTDLGNIGAGPGMAYGFLRIDLQPFGSNTGAWYLDDVRITATPAVSTGIMEQQPSAGEGGTVHLDLLGRPTTDRSVTGAYITEGRRVFVP